MMSRLRTTIVIRILLQWIGNSSVSGFVVARRKSAGASLFINFQRLQPHEEHPVVLYQQSTTSTEQENSDSKPIIPANLRRKVQARRDTLGHVVPKKYRTRTSSSSSGGTGGAKSVQAQGRDQRHEDRNNPSLLKISAGSRRGRRLQSPTFVYLRPMMGKVKEAVFSTLTSFGLYDPASKRNTRHLDIFSGSGSVGLESLSRGSSHCTFVDLSRDCCDTIQRNLDLLEFGVDDDEQQHRVICADYLQTLRDPASVGLLSDDDVESKFHIVTLCPPYEEVVYADLLEAVVSSPLVMDDTVVLVEYPVELGCLPHVVASSISSSNGNTMVGIRNRKYGRTVIAMYVVNPTGKLEENGASSRPEEFVSLKKNSKRG